jgi:hypothetical protein
MCVWIWRGVSPVGAKSLELEVAVPSLCRDLVGFFNSSGWALYGHMKSIRKHLPTGRRARRKRARSAGLSTAVSAHYLVNIRFSGESYPSVVLIGVGRGRRDLAGF